MASIQSSTDTRVAKPGMSLRDRLSGYMASGLDFFETDARRKAFPNISQSMAKELMPIAENIPGIGQGLAAEDVGAAAKDKDWLGMGLAALGLVPGLGPEKKALEPVAEAGRAALTEAKSGIKAYHGSPHSFDQFDISKIGTGEGAQAYGHGLYFAENEGVAKSYKEGLSGRASKITHPSLGEFGDQDAMKMDELFINEAQQAAPTLARSRIEEIGTQVTEGLRQGGDIAHMEKFVRQSDWDPPEKAAWLAALNRAKEFKVEISPGHMYEVNINADPEHFLDWDKPLSEQPHAQNKLADTLLPYHAERAGMKDPTGAQLMQKVMGDHPSESDKLRELGIPGIKYLDAGSRAAAEGSRNYVVFDPKIIDIVKKYGIAAAVGAGLVSPMMAEQMRRQGVVEEQS